MNLSNNFLLNGDFNDVNIIEAGFFANYRTFLVDDQGNYWVFFYEYKDHANVFIYKFDQNGNTITSFGDNGLLKFSPNSEITERHLSLKLIPDIGGFYIFGYQVHPESDGNNRISATVRKYIPKGNSTKKISKENHINVYYSHGSLIFSNSNPTHVKLSSVELYDMIGNSLWELDQVSILTIESHHQLPTSILPGIYILRALTEEGHEIIKKVLIY